MTPLDLALAMVSFAFVTSFTPGPNNIMITASGANFGFARSIPHILGVAIGFAVLVAACGAGLGALFMAFPAAQLLLKIAGALYMLWLAWKVANAGSPASSSDTVAQPLTFLQAAAFQWVNPKAVVTALGAIAIYVRPDHAVSDTVVIVAICGLAAILSISAWAGFGVVVSGLLHDPVRARVFNIVMAVLLVVSIVPMVL